MLPILCQLEAVVSHASPGRENSFQPTSTVYMYHNVMYLWYSCLKLEVGCWVDVGADNGDHDHHHIW